ncbi:hypothetical protein D9757_006865 [Collybiopsis confluens]|uniref:Uncharacterized protein n=1 Tax=Collybiopsis confluens TaxID=2823264 RepID=A0A8H5HQE4_9AGAR|nr:hypothetical protein D9757_006865 [Collybiopsis confluens]
MSQRPRRSWSKSEDTVLRQFVELSPDNPRWCDISKSLPGRTPKDCRKRWVSSLDAVLIKGPWTSIEDSFLREAVEQYGTDWAAVSRALSGRRSGDQCSKRWRQVVNPSINRDPWTKEDDRLLLQLYGRHSNSWQLISTYFPNRTDLQCRNRCCHLLGTRTQSKTERRRLMTQKTKQVVEESFNSRTTKSEPLPSRLSETSTGVDQNYSTLLLDSFHTSPGPATPPSPSAFCDPNSPDIAMYDGSNASAADDCVLAEQFWQFLNMTIQATPLGVNPANSDFGQRHRVDPSSVLGLSPTSESQIHSRLPPRLDHGMSSMIPTTSLISPPAAAPAPSLLLETAPIYDYHHHQYHHPFTTQTGLSTSYHTSLDPAISTSPSPQMSRSPSSPYSHSPTTVQQDLSMVPLRSSSERTGSVSLMGQHHHHLSYSDDLNLNSNFVPPSLSSSQQRISGQSWPLTATASPTQTGRRQMADTTPHTFHSFQTGG